MSLWSSIAKPTWQYEVTAPEVPLIRLVQGLAHARIGKPDKAEVDFAAAVEARPDDLRVWIARSYIFAEMGQYDRAEADFAKAIALAPNDPHTLIARGRYLAERGNHQAADEDFAKAAGLASDELNVFPESGWWVAGPYPVDINLVCSPEKHQSPETKIPAAKQEQGWESKWLAWHSVGTDANGIVNLSRIFPTQPLSSAAGSYYGLCFIDSPNDRDVILNVGSAAPIRVWLNEQLVHESRDHTFVWAPGVAAVRFRAGRNKLLVKVTCTADTHFHFICRVNDSREDRAMTLASRGLWEEAAKLLTEENAKTVCPTHHYVRHQIDFSLFASKGCGNQEVLERYADRFALTPNPDIGFAFARNMLQSLQFDTTSVPLVSLAEMGRSVKGFADPYFGSHIAWANFRAGKCQEALALAKPLDRYAYPANDFVIAMATFRLGDVEEARRRLKRGEDWYLATIREGLQNPIFVMPPDWEMWGTYQIIYREAKTLIEGQPYTDEPLLLIATGRERALLGFNERPKRTFRKRWRSARTTPRCGPGAGGSSPNSAGTRKPRPTWRRPRLPGKTSNDWYNLACARAACLNGVGRGKQVLTDAEKLQREQLEALAVQTFQEALSQGYEKAEQAKTDGDLKSLRERPDFQALIARLEQAELGPQIGRRRCNSSVPARQTQGRGTSERLSTRNWPTRSRPACRRQLNLVLSFDLLAVVQRDMRDYEQAERSVSRAITLREQIVKQSPETVAYRTSLGATHVELGKIQWLAGRYKEAEASWDKGIKITRGLYPRGI